MSFLPDPISKYCLKSGRTHFFNFQITDHIPYTNMALTSELETKLT